MAALSSLVEVIKFYPTGKHLSFGNFIKHKNNNNFIDLQLSTNKVYPCSPLEQVTAIEHDYEET